MLAEHYLNADFDLNLRRRPSRITGAARRQVRELASQWLLAAGPAESVLLWQPLPAEFLHHLEAGGFALPRVSVLPAVDRDADFRPFGWDRAALELAGRYRRPPEHPPPEVVRTVNGRRYAAGLERELPGGSPVAGICSSMDEVVSVVSRGRSPTGWVVKCEHGNSGLGNRRIRPGGLSAADLRVVGRYLQEDDGVTVEPWHRRNRDLCTTMTVTRDRRAHDIHVHEVINTADGAFLGALFESEPEWAAGVEPALSETASEVARRLGEDGYFGPVALDAYTWSDGGRQRLRMLSDVNARRHVSAAGLRLWRLWGCDRVVYWRLFVTRRLKVRALETSEGFQFSLGRDRYDPERRRGAMLLSPLRTVDGALLGRIVVLLAGASRGEVLAMEARIRNRLER